MPDLTSQQKHTDWTRKFYETVSQCDLGSVRSGHGDAAHMCDAIAADILREHTVRGRVTNQGRALAEAVKRAGDAIWAMRGLVPGSEPTVRRGRDASDVVTQP